MARKTVRKKTISVKPSLPVNETVEPVKNSRFKFPNRLFAIILIFTLVAGLLYFGRTLFIVATVNGQPVSRLTVIKELEKQGGKKTLDLVILKYLIDQEASKKNISTNQNEIDNEIKSIEANISSQGSTLDAVLAQQGMTRENLIDDVRLQLLITKMVGDDPEVSDKEIDDFITLRKEQLTLSGLEDDEMSRDDAKKQIQQQKTQEAIQSFMAKLKQEAKINYWLDY